MSSPLSAASPPSLLLELEVEGSAVLAALWNAMPVDLVLEVRSSNLYRGDSPANPTSTAPRSQAGRHRDAPLTFAHLSRLAITPVVLRFETDLEDGKKGSWDAGFGLRRYERHPVRDVVLRRFLLGEWPAPLLPGSTVDFTAIGDLSQADVIGPQTGMWSEDRQTGGLGPPLATLRRMLRQIVSVCDWVFNRQSDLTYIICSVINDPDTSRV